MILKKKTETSTDHTFAKFTLTNYRAVQNKCWMVQEHKRLFDT